MSIDMIIALEQEADKLKSYTAGAIAILILIGLLVALVAFGGGREHS